MVVNTLLDVVFPRICAGCGERVGGESHYLCWECLSELLLIRPPYCERCGDPVEGRVDDAFVCYTCASKKIYFERARSAARYDRVLRQVLQEFKYRRAIWLRKDLTDLLHACLLLHYEPGEIDVVCPVPMHRRRRRERGYNQAQLLAASVARRIQKRLISGALARSRPTRSQTDLTASQRIDNVKKAFEPRRHRLLGGKRVLLVDDVMTTGATVNECAKVLKKVGAASVHVITVARG